MINQAVILAGGKGTRLASRLNGRPKPLIDVLGVPLLQRQLLALKDAGLGRVLVLVNHEAAQIERFCAAAGNFGLDVTIIDDGVPRGTAGATLQAWPQLESEFLVVYGDTLFELDFSRFIDFHAADSGAAATLFLHPNDHPHDSDLVALDAAGTITAFHPYPHPDGLWLPNMVNAALYLARREAFAPWRDTEGLVDFAKDLFPQMLAAGVKLRGYVSPEYIKDIGTPSRLDRAEQALASGMVAGASLKVPQTAVFLDRDGTLNIPNGHISDPAALELFPFAPAAVKAINRAGMRAVLITNQPVLARGDCDEAGLAAIHAKLETRLGAGGAYLDRLYVCPHHPDSGFLGEAPALKIVCDCRKPAPGLLHQASQALNIDLRASWMVGDSLADVGAAAAAGVTSVLVRTGVAIDNAQAEANADFVTADVASAARLITETYPRLAATLAPLADGIAPGGDLIVAGQSRSGKTTLAAALARELRLAGREARHIALDRWLRPDGEQAPGLEGRFDLDSIAAVFAAAARRRHGETIALSLPVFSLHSRRYSDPPTPLVVGPQTILIWEGVIAFALARQLDLWGDCVFVASDETGRRARVVAEYLRRGRNDLQAEAVYRSRLEDEIAPLAKEAGAAALSICLDPLFAPSDKPS